MTLPTCYRCGDQPCSCEDQITLYHADALDVLPLLEEGSVDLVLTDPPYGETQLAWDCTPALEWTKHLGSLAKDAVVVTCASWRYGHKLTQAMPLPFHYEYVWVKNTVTRVLDANRRPLANHEFVLVFGSTRYNRIEWPRTENVERIGDEIHPKQAHGDHWGKVGLRKAYTFKTTTCPVTAFSCARKGNYYAKSRGNHHPTKKPLAMCDHFVQTYSDVGHTILDPFAGSGTTGRVAKDLGRKCIMVELEEKYCAIAANRLQQGVLF